mmetsp:Transcript_23184/g.78232  ORF Transcript_23184/g.78232 Transcript_23184/m.78232 type:complete len:212 (-) Transcript_23184:566-1201(-)
MPGNNHRSQITHLPWRAPRWRRSATLAALARACGARPRGSRDPIHACTCTPPLVSALSCHARAPPAPCVLAPGDLADAQDSVVHLGRAVERALRHCRGREGARLRVEVNFAVAGLQRREGLTNYAVRPAHRCCIPLCVHRDVEAMLWAGEAIVYVVASHGDAPFVAKLKDGARELYADAHLLAGLVGASAKEKVAAPACAGDHVVPRVPGT